jgi:hypothetical protein
VSYSATPPALFASGTGDGFVTIQPLSADASASGPALEAPGTVRALTFRGETTVVVGGDFRGLYLLTPGAVPAQVVPSSIGTRGLVTWGQDLVALTDAGLRLAALGNALRVTLAGYVILALVGATLVGFVGVHPARRRAAVRRRVEPATSPSAAPPTPLPEIQAERWQVPSPPEGLVVACRKGECVLYAGAGLSAQAGLPTWRPFLRGLLQRADESGLLEPGVASSMRAALDQEITDPVADGLVNAFREKPDRLLDYLRAVFLSPDLSLPPTHRLLQQLSWSAALTTNFDDLLERTYADQAPRVLTPADSEPLLEALAKRAFFLLKLYGTLEHPQTIVVAPAAFNEVIAKNRPFSSVMEGVFVARTLLFLGTSLEGIETYLSGLSLKEHLTRPHYALVGVTGTAWQARADLLQRRYGIEVLPYTPSDGYPEVSAFLDALVRAVRAEIEPGLHASEVTPAESDISRRLRRVQLHNVGPFVSFSVELTPGWTVLLGDNGVGKSNILRAIAVGLCGRDAETYAGRLIKAGETSATIVLETDDATYRSEVRRTETGATSVTVVPVRPLEVEGWLALGFPPLRSVSWSRPKGPTADGHRRPSVDDLLPLVRGEPDPRLDGLKQWIVNLDGRINYERTRETDDTR